MKIAKTTRLPEVRVRYGVLIRERGQMYVRDEDTGETFLAPTCRYVVLEPTLAPLVTFTVASTLKKGEPWADRVYFRP